MRFPTFPFLPTATSRPARRRILLFLLPAFFWAAPALRGQNTLPQLDSEPELLLAGDRTEIVSPIWSPDGTRIAYTSTGYAGLWTLNMRDRSVAQVSDEPAAGFGFSWSPDGAALLTRVARFDGVRRTNAVKVFDVESGAESQLTEYRSLMPAIPAWAPNGTEVVLADRLRVERLESGRQVDPAKVVRSAPAFLLRSLQLTRLDPETGDLLPFGPFEEGRVVEAVPSPDRMLVAVRVAGEGLFVLSADGARVSKLGDGNFPTWSPDGRWVIFTRLEDDGHVLTAADLVVAAADGSARAALTETPDRLEMSASWSPDGAWVVYVVDGSLYRARLRTP